MGKKRQTMSDDLKAEERERARERYRRDGGAQAKRCYLRHLRLGNIKRPRPETLAKWGVGAEDPEYIFVSGEKGGCHQEREMA